MKRISKLTAIIFGVVMLLGLSNPANAAIYLGGNRNDRLSNALNVLGESYTLDSNWMINPAGLGSGDIIILGLDGGSTPFFDYNNFLNSGGDLILTGGSSLTVYRTWASNYFNIVDISLGWHRDGAWTSTSNHTANKYLPLNYSFTNDDHTYHMLAFGTTSNTTILGRNDEPNNIAAFREYSNGGSFNYMALDLGFRAGDETNFITPWLKGGLEAARSQDAPVPEPATMLLLGSGLLGLFGFKRKRK